MIQHKILQRFVSQNDQIDLFSLTLSGKQYLFPEVYRLLLSSGLGADAQTFREALVERLGEQIASLGARNENYRYGFCRDFLAFSIEALDAGIFDPVEIQPLFNLAEDTALRLKSALSPPLSYLIASEYIRYAARTGDSHFLECAEKFISLSITRGTLAGHPTEGDFESKIFLTLAKGYAEVGRKTGVNYLTTLRLLSEKINDPLCGLEARFLLYSLGRSDGTIPFESLLPEAEVLKLLKMVTDPHRRLLAYARAAQLSLELERRSEADQLLTYIFEHLGKAFLIARKGDYFARMMEIFRETAETTQDPRDLEPLEKALSIIKPKTAIFHGLAQDGALEYVRALSHFYIHSGDRSHLVKMQSVVEVHLTRSTLITLAQAYIGRKEPDAALRTIYKIEDDTQRGPESYLLEARAWILKNSSVDFVQTLEKILKQAEVSSVLVYGETRVQGALIEKSGLEVLLDALKDDVIAIGRTRFFRRLVELAQRKLQPSDTRYRVEIGAALGLIQIARRQSDPDSQSPREILAMGVDVIEKLPAVRKFQGLLEVARMFQDSDGVESEIA